MLSFALAAFAVLALWPWCLAAALSASPSRTSAPKATGTHCPLYYTTPAANAPPSRCSVLGHLPDNTSYLSRSCLRDTEGITKCYQDCVQDPKCVAYSQDPYNQICTNYGATLESMGFTPSNDTNVLYWDLEECYVCDQPNILPVHRTYCPASPELLTGPHKNYTCGSYGTLLDDSYVQELYGNNFLESCYNACAGYDIYGACESFAFYPYAKFSEPFCRLYYTSLYQKGFRADNTSSAQNYNLRGCFKCNATKPIGSDCVPTVIPVNPVARNGNFSLTNFRQSTNTSVPRYWAVAPDGTRSVTGLDGNKFVEMFADASHGATSTSQTSFSQQISGFDQNPGSPGRFYNISWDLSIVNISTPHQDYNCHLSTTFGDFITLKATSSPTPWRTIGPRLLDLSTGTIAYLKAGFELRCPVSPPDQPPNFGGNATVWIDNVVWSQHGKQVGNV